MEGLTCWFPGGRYIWFASEVARAVSTRVLSQFLPRHPVKKFRKEHKVLLLFFRDKLSKASWVSWGAQTGRD